MRIIESRVRSCIEEHIIIDKKMREHRFKYKRYNILLNDDQPFKEDEAVKIISTDDLLALQINKNPEKPLIRGIIGRLIKN